MTGNSQVQINYWRYRCQNAEAEAQRLKGIEEAYHDLREKVQSIAHDLDRLGGQARE